MPMANADNTSANMERKTQETSTQNTALKIESGSK